MLTESLLFKRKERSVKTVFAKVLGKICEVELSLQVHPGATVPAFRRLKTAFVKHRTEKVIKATWL